MPHPKRTGCLGDELRTLAWSNNLAQTPILKEQRADFRVCESLVLPLVPTPADATCAYVLLSKQGFNTRQAVDLIAHFLGVTPEEIGRACSKDDDGITQQHLSVPMECTSRVVEEFNLQHNSDGGKLHLAWQGWGDRPLADGMMHGNSFRVNVRSLTVEAAYYLHNHAEITHYFINYFDAQFFNGPALDRAHEKAAASLWNRDLRTMAYNLARGNVAQVTRAGQDYTFVRETAPILNLLHNTPETPHLADQRPTVTQARIRIGQPTTDPSHPHTFQCELSFFLPDRVYASTALAQLLGPVLDYQKRQ